MSRWVSEWVSVTEWVTESVSQSVFRVTNYASHWVLPDLFTEKRVWSDHLPKLLALWRVNSRTILTLKKDHFKRKSWAHSWKVLPSFTCWKERWYDTIVTSDVLGDMFDMFGSLQDSISQNTTRHLGNILILSLRIWACCEQYTTLISTINWRL